jgi:hypothetical protein
MLDGHIEEIMTRQQLKLFETHNLLCYTGEQVKREAKEILQCQQSSRYIQFVCYSRSSNYSSCSDLLSKYSFVILHTTTVILIYLTTLCHPTLQYLTPLSYHTKLYIYAPAILTNHFHIYKHLCLSITQNLPDSLCIGKSANRL